MGNVFHILPVLAKFNKAFVVCSIYNHLKEFIQKLSRHRCQSQHRTIHHKKWHVDPKRQAQLRRTQNLVSFLFFDSLLCFLCRFMFILCNTACLFEYGHLVQMCTGLDLYSYYAFYKIIPESICIFLCRLQIIDIL